jgi:hypothetical protein
VTVAEKKTMGAVLAVVGSQAKRFLIASRLVPMTAFEHDVGYNLHSSAEDRALRGGVVIIHSTAKLGK